MSQRKNNWRTLAIGAALMTLVPWLGLAAPSDSLNELLRQTGKQMEAFVDHFSLVKCTELVEQTKLGKEERVLEKEDSVFDYLALLQAADGELTVNESRLAQKETGQDPKNPLLVTNGFSTLLLIFHPDYQPSFEFAELEDKEVDGKRLAQIAFRYIHGRPSPAVLLLRGREYPLPFTGIAWVDRESGAIVRIQAGIDGGMEDIGLRSLHSDVRYAAFKFPPETQTYWLPVTATIELETPRQHWRNVHRFTAYKHFAVATQSTIGQQP